MKNKRLVTKPTSLRRYSPTSSYAYITTNANESKDNVTGMLKRYSSRRAFTVLPNSVSSPSIPLALSLARSFRCFASSSSTTSSFGVSPSFNTNTIPSKLSVSSPTVSKVSSTSNSSSPPNPCPLKAEEKVEFLRALLRIRKYDAFLVPSGDPHLSEYTSDFYSRRAFISDFDGSAGTALILRKESSSKDISKDQEIEADTGALLWTDGRYHLQAEKQLDAKVWTLMKQGQDNVPSIEDYLKKRLPPGSVVALDGTVSSAKFVLNLQNSLKEYGISLEIIKPDEKKKETNPIDEVWNQYRPICPDAPAKVHPLKYSGETIQSKLNRIGERMKEEGAKYLVLCALDDVAYTFNIRGADIPNSPVPAAFALLERKEMKEKEGEDSRMHATLYIHKSKLGNEVKDHLEEANVIIKPYENVYTDLNQIRLKRNAMVKNLGGYEVDSNLNKNKIWIDKNTCNFALLEAAVGKVKSKTVLSPGSMVEKIESLFQSLYDFPSEPKKKKVIKPASVTNIDNNFVVSNESPVTMMKACKNEAEMAGMRAAHLRDGAAEVEFFAWLYDEIQTKRKRVNELNIDAKLTSFRSEREGFTDLSFPTIAGVGSNGAIIHYRAVPGEQLKVLEGNSPTNGMLLLDSGAQYLDGTTDVTRTLHLGEPTSFMKEAFTRVLKGHIGVDSITFPEGTPGFAVDILARAALWKSGMDYAHGTGHGVGASLMVHEGPQGISFNWNNKTPLKPGMILSNEPGFYQANEFGIRIENLLVVVPATPASTTTGSTNLDPRQRKYLKFERLTHIPIDKKCIDPTLLTQDEIQWIDNYHSEVYRKISPLLSDFARKWLQKATSPLLGEEN